jgi:hypothetical protein
MPVCSSHPRIHEQTVLWNHLPPKLGTASWLLLQKSEVEPHRSLSSLLPLAQGHFGMWHIPEDYVPCRILASRVRFCDFPPFSNGQSVQRAASRQVLTPSSVLWPGADPHTSQRSNSLACPAVRSTTGVSCSQGAFILMANKKSQASETSSLHSYYLGLLHVCIPSSKAYLGRERQDTKSLFI